MADSELLDFQQQKNGVVQTLGSQRELTQEELDLGLGIVSPPPLKPETLPIPKAGDEGFISTPESTATPNASSSSLRNSSAFLNPPLPMPTFIISPESSFSTTSTPTTPYSPPPATTPSPTKSDPTRPSSAPKIIVGVPSQESDVQIQSCVSMPDAQDARTPNAKDVRNAKSFTVIATIQLK